jgi:hypothetical protein
MMNSATNNDLPSWSDGKQMNESIPSARTRSIFLFALTLGFLGIAAAVPVGAWQLRSATTKLTVKNPQCVPGQCVCSGAIDASARLNELGILASMLKRGIRCIVADFDGNGVPDYAIPGAEGSAAIILMSANRVARVAVIDAGGLLELYPPRNEPGDRGEPVSRNYALLVRWVGRQHAVFLWNGDGFTRALFPAQ